METQSYHPVTAVWEVTMGCNMRCRHCGSSCNEPLPDELCSEEAFDVIRQMAELGLQWVTLSGGEPLIRPDICELIRHLKSSNIKANIITNGWLLESMAEKLKEAGISTVAISIDGPPEVHDNIRRSGAYKRLEAGIRRLKELEVTVGAITTITKQNIGLLEEIRDELIRMQVDSWQVQLGLPMGNLKSRPEWVIDPEEVDTVIDFCYETMREGKIRIYPADCIGYYNQKEQEVRRDSYRTDQVLWDGCNAGVRGFGLLHNGDILGCTSIRSREFIEGNIRERPLAEIWNDPKCFLWRRQMTKQQLSGNCGKCVYGSKCLGGCPNTRLTMEGSIRQSENRFCSYNNYLRKLEHELTECNDAGLLWQEAGKCANDEWQRAALYCERILQLGKTDAEVYKMQGYVEFMCGNYEVSESANLKALEWEPEDPYALKGLALSLHRQHKSPEQVLSLLEQADTLSRHQDSDLLHDIEVVKQELSSRSK